ncbi:1,3-beta-glucan synthase regulator [Bacillus pseudomycoides]|nr:1,3-beta-glucan synthase regulator [Bacillus pseudomycoides]
MTNIVWRKSDENIGEGIIKQIANQLGVLFPEDYIKCAQINHGGRVRPDVFEVDGEERVFGILLSYDENSEINILKEYHSYKDTLPKELVPFGIDPAGNLICFDYKNHEEDPIVVFWEHEDAWEKEGLMESEGITTEEAEEVARENVFYVASTFTEFLNKLHD